MDSNKKTIAIELDGKELEAKMVAKLKQKFPEVDEDLIKEKAHEAVHRLAGKDLIKLFADNFRTDEQIVLDSKRLVEKVNPEIDRSFEERLRHHQ